MMTTATFEPTQAQAAPAAGNSLLRSLRPALQWRLMLLWLLALLLPTLAAALPLWTMLGAAFDHTLNAAALARRLDLVAIADVMSLHTRYAPALAGGGGVALALTLLLSPLLTGAAITAARAPAPLGFAALAAGGVREYGRLLRMLLWAVVPLGVAAFLGALVLDAADGQAAGAVIGASLVAGLLVLLAHATLDLGRAVLALDRRRGSAVLAWCDGLGLLVQRPFAVLGLYLGLTALGLLLAAVLALARLNVPALGAGSLLGGLLMAQLAVLALAWMRCARLFGLMELARGMHAR